MGNLVSYDAFNDLRESVNFFQPSTEGVKNQEGSVMRLSYENSRYCIQSDDDHLVGHSPLIRLEFVHHRLGTFRFFGYAHDECIYTIDPITDKRRYIDPASIGGDGGIIKPMVVENVEVVVTTRETFWSTWIHQTKDYEYRFSTVLDADGWGEGVRKTYFINTALYECTF